MSATNTPRYSGAYAILSAALDARLKACGCRKLRWMCPRLKCWRNTGLHSRSWRRDRQPRFARLGAEVGKMRAEAALIQHGLTFANCLQARRYVFSFTMGPFLKRSPLKNFSIAGKSLPSA